jgi:alkaline phosphatase D
VKIDAIRLKPSTTYHYRFKVEDDLGAVSRSPVGSFKTAPDSNSPSNVKFTYTGDSDGVRPGGTPAYNNFEVNAQQQAENGDFWVYLGDTIYSDSEAAGVPPATTLDEYRAKYKENRTYPNLTSLFASTSTYAQWDDHEVTNDFDGQTVNPAQYAAGRQAFLEYMPIRTTGLLQDPTCAGDPLYRKFKWGSDIDVFVLDERSCKSADVAASCISPRPGRGVDLGPTLPPSVRGSFPFFIFLDATAPPGCLDAINDPGRTVLGPVQKAAFKNDLLASTAKHKVIVNEFPIQQFYALPYDRWEGYGAERSELLNFIRDNDIGNVEFLTTDTHANLVNQVFIDRFTDPGTIANELVTGPIGTKTLEREIIDGFGAAALNAFRAVLNVAGLDCANLNEYSYGSVNHDSTAGTVRVDLKDDAGQPVQNTAPLFPCTKTFGP